MFLVACIFFFTFLGSSGCLYADIEGFHEVYCLASYACSQTEITDVPIIYGLGYYALNSATIYSGGIGEMNVTVGGYLAGQGLKIYCDGVGDHCTIKCFGTACSSTTVYCLWKATCTLDCDINGNETGISCPTLDIYKTPTKEPTTIPSSYPTVMPTPPTTSPTGAPSAPPTKPPTNNPTSAPSNNPSSVPSTAPSLSR